MTYKTFVLIQGYTETLIALSWTLDNRKRPHHPFSLQNMFDTSDSLFAFNYAGFYGKTCLQHAWYVPSKEVESDLQGTCQYWL